MRPPQLRNQDQADDPFRERLVELRRMQRNSERHAGGRVRIRERDGPGQMRRFAPAATGGEASQAPDPVPDRESRRKQIATSQARASPARACRRYAKTTRQDEAAEKDARALQRGQREDLAGMRAVFGIERDHQHLRPQHSRQRAINAEIDDFFAVDAALFRELRRHRERHEKRQRHQHAVGGQRETSDLDQSWKHISETCSAPGCGAAKASCSESTIPPLYR